MESRGSKENPFATAPTNSSQWRTRISATSCAPKRSGCGVRLLRTRGIDARETGRAPSLVRTRNAYGPTLCDAILAPAQAHHRFRGNRLAACDAGRDQILVFLGFLARHQSPPHSLI